MNVKAANNRTITILVQVTCLYPIRWKMLHTAHHFSPNKVVLPIFPLQKNTGLDSLPHLIWLCMDRGGWIKCMTRLFAVCDTSTNKIIFSLVDMTATLISAPLVKWRNYKPNHLYWNQETLINTIPMTSIPMKNWSIFTTFPMHTVSRNMGRIFSQHMNSILVESWYLFKVSTSNIIRGRFV